MEGHSCTFFGRRSSVYSDLQNDCHYARKHSGLRITVRDDSVHKVLRRRIVLVPGIGWHWLRNQTSQGRRCWRSHPSMSSIHAFSSKPQSAAFAAIPAEQPLLVFSVSHERETRTRTRTRRPQHFTTPTTNTMGWPFATESPLDSVAHWVPARTPTVHQCLYGRPWVARQTSTTRQDQDNDETNVTASLSWQQTGPVIEVQIVKFVD